MSDSRAEQFEVYRVWLKFLAQAGISGELRPKIDASDIAQETLIRASQKKPEDIQDAAQVRGWLRTVLTNVLKDEVRKFTSQKRDMGLERAIEVRVDETAFALEIALASDAPPPSAVFVLQENAVRVQAALARLPDLERRAIEMKHCHGCSVQEIATTLGKTPAAVAGLLRRGLKSLRDELPREN